MVSISSPASFLSNYCNLSYQLASPGTNVLFWLPVIQKIIDCLVKNKTWKIVPSPKSTNVFTGKGVLTVKVASSYREELFECADAIFVARDFQ